jgi:hypothetical protein
VHLTGLIGASFGCHTRIEGFGVTKLRGTKASKEKEIMEENGSASLVNSKNDIKRKIETGDYFTLIDIVLDKGFSNFLRKLAQSKNPVSSWISGLVLACFTLLIGFGISGMTGEFSALDQSTIFFTIWLAGIGFLWMICAKIGYHLILNTLSKGVIENIASHQDLEDIQKKLHAFRNIKLQIFLSIFLGLAALLWPVIWSQTGATFPGYGPTAILILVWSQTGPGVYLFFLYIWLAAGINRYEYSIRTIDARSSEVIEYLSDMFNGVLLIGAVILAVFSIGLAFLEAFDVQLFLVWVLGAWAVLLLMFFNNQYILANIIKKHKRKKLREIQKEIYSLEADKNIADKETLETIKLLMDYYDRVEKMPESALRIGEVFRLIQALWLPILASVISSVEDVIAIFSK